MAEDSKLNIWIGIGDVKRIPLSIRQSDEEVFRKAESMVNQLWGKWKTAFGAETTSEEVMARIAFQFARLFVEERTANKEVNNLLEDFESKLDDIVVKGLPEKNI